MRASLETDLKAVQAKILKGPEKLKTERAKLQKLLAEPDLAQAVRASLQTEFEAVQTKLSAGGKVLPLVWPWPATQQAGSAPAVRSCSAVRLCGA